MDEVLKAPPKLGADFQSAVVSMGQGAIVPVKLSRQAKSVWVRVQNLRTVMGSVA